MSFFTDEKFAFPFWSSFFATAGASLTILILQFANGYLKDKRKKIYSAAYMSDVCFRITMSNLILKKHTVIPHIEAVKRLINGDEHLLNTMFLADEFDILTDKSFNFKGLSEEYKVLLGCDDISLIQSYETLVYMAEDDKTRASFNAFVESNLKSEHLFKSHTKEKQTDILNTYWDYLERLKHQKDRSISFALEIVLPSILNYVGNKQFWCVSTKGILATASKIKNVVSDFKEVLPEEGYIQKTMHGGIQKAL